VDRTKGAMGLSFVQQNGPKWTWPKSPSGEGGSGGSKGTKNPSIVNLQVGDRGVLDEAGLNVQVSKERRTEDGGSSGQQGKRIAFLTTWRDLSGGGIENPYFWKTVRS